MNMVLIKDYVRSGWLCGAVLAGLGMILTFSVSCRAASEDAALQALREMTKDGRLPSESVVANIEARYAGQKTGALARLLRARIRLENGDAAGAAELLASDVFAERTRLGDYALWLRGKAFLQAGDRDAARRVLGELLGKYPNSMRAAEAALLRAESLLSEGRAAEVPKVLRELNAMRDPAALLLTAKAYEQTPDRTPAADFYRQAYFYGAGTKAGDEAEARLKELGEDLSPRTAGESLARAEDLLAQNKYAEAGAAFDEHVRRFPGEVSVAIQLGRLTANARAKRMSSAAEAFGAIPLTAKEKEEAFHELAVGYARARQWDEVRETLGEMRKHFPRSERTPETLVGVAEQAGSQRRSADEDYYHKLALALYPESVHVTKAHFEVAWRQHELKNYAEAAKLLTEHLARYVDKDNSFRGQTGYWAARNSERAGLLDEACALYDGTVYRYGSNWYGYLALDRLTALRRQGHCQTPPKFPADSLVPRAVENLRVVTVAAETATAKELEHAAKSDELSTIGLFDWAIEELEEARKTAANSPKINLALAQYYRKRGENVRALLALADSYPDYPQMFPEEMGREEWDIFYPLTNWNEIKYWADKRDLDPYHVAGLIRQESVFNPKAASSARAYGLMQLLVPTARMMARKYSDTNSSTINSTALFNPALNIELGTAYMREQLSKYGRLEYMSVAYNAGPGRVVRWRKELPLQIDEFVEEIPFRETKGYVKGVIRNSAQYRRLYDLNGEFKPNVGSRPLRGAIDSKPAGQFALEHPEIDVDRERRTGRSE